ncbi:MAG: ATP-binding cassette domain-containing protein [Methanotrichaceae archaeon]|jgi:cobalt/nickel transport system ATP-binding protein
MSLLESKRTEPTVCHISAEPELIHVDCVSHIYPDGSVGIHNLCFKVQDKEIVAICGGNGSGKSTLLEHLNGLLTPSDGCVSVFGKRLDTQTKKDLWKDVGIVFQRAEDQLFAPTVLDDVMFGPLNMGMSIDDAKQVALEALTAVGAEELVNKMPNYLSGGQKRLVSMAGVLAMKPKIMALDEPTSDLDPNHAEIIEKIILELKNKYGISVVIATHDLDLAAQIADRICIVKSGSIIAEGTPAEIFYNSELLEEAGLKKPKIVQIYDEFCKSRGLDHKDRPVKVEELAKCFTCG